MMLRVSEVERQPFAKPQRNSGARARLDQQVRELMAQRGVEDRLLLQDSHGLQADLASARECRNPAWLSGGITIGVQRGIELDERLKIQLPSQIRFERRQNSFRGLKRFCILVRLGAEHRDALAFA